MWRGMQERKVIVHLAGQDMFGTAFSYIFLLFFHCHLEIIQELRSVKTNLRGQCSIPGQASNRTPPHPNPVAPLACDLSLRQAMQRVPPATCQETRILGHIKHGHRKDNLRFKWFRAQQESIIIVICFFACIASLKTSSDIRGLINEQANIEGYMI